MIRTLIPYYKYHMTWM